MNAVLIGLNRKDKKYQNLKNHQCILFEMNHRRPTNSVNYDIDRQKI